MTDQSPGNAQFFLTAPMPCPYLEGHEERKLFTHLNGRRATAMHHMLSEHGFRRSQNLIYRPACVDCASCKSVRIVARDFSPSQRFRRVIKRNSDLVGREVPPIASEEQFELFTRYLVARHEGGGMTQMNLTDYECMVEDTPVSSFLVEYRIGNGGPLAAVSLCDSMRDGYSMVYSFFDPKLSQRGLGNYIILDHISRVLNEGMSYVYLGYWVQESQKMAYKAQFKPLEVQTGPMRWQPLDCEAAPDARD